MTSASVASAAPPSDRDWETDGNAISSVFSNGSSNSSIQFNVPAGFDVTIVGLNTTNYQIFGNVTSTTAPAFADQ